MATSAANESRFFFSNPDIPQEELEVVDFVGREAISQLSRFELNLVSKNPSVPFSDVVDRPAMLTMQAGTDRSYVHGVVADFQQGSPVGDYFSYRAVLVPRLWRLSLTYQSRVFQHLSVPEIVRQVLQESGYASDDFRFGLTASYQPREYCTQYQETDLAFLSRLLEYEGIQFFFEQEEEREVLVLTDNRGENPPIGSENAKVIYRPSSGMVPAHEETVREFVFREQAVTGRVVLKDYNYRTPDADIRAEFQISDELSGVHYEYGSNIKDAGEAERLARVRNEEIECRRRLATGEGTSMYLRAGHHFTLDKHYRLDLNQSYLVTEVTHYGSQRGLVSMQVGEDAAMPYRNVFTCVPVSVQFRPLRVTPEPKLPGIMTAKVESGGGDYAYLDDEGRYRIKMPFDLAETEQAGASKPIRLAQPYAGADYGMHFPVHADAEMVFACVDGNVDRPLGLSTVPNPAQGSPVKGENHTRNVIRTASKNEIYMEDEVGNERIKIESPYKNSILQLGSPNVAADGVCLTTDGATAVHGKEGVFISAWGSIDPSQSLAAWKAGLSVLDGSMGVVAAALGLRPLSLLSATNFAGSFASLVTGVLGQGAYITAPHGVGLYSSTSVSAVAGAGGIGLYSAAGADICSAAGIYLGTVAGGVHIGAAQGGVKVAAGIGNIEIETKTDDIVLTTKLGNIKLDAFDKMSLAAGTGRVRIESESDKLECEARKDIEIKSREGNVRVEADQAVNIKSSQERVVIEAEKEIVLKCGDTTLKISPDGIDLDTKNYVEVKSGGSVNAYAGGSRGPALLMGASGSFSIANNMAAYSLDTSGKAAISAVQVDINAKAMAQLKAALTKVG